MGSMRRFTPLVGGLATAVAGLAGPADAEKIQFVRDVRPILQDQCVECHGRGRHKGGLSMATRKSLLEGGDSGAVVKPGHPGKSLLVQKVEKGEMPKEGPSLKKKAIRKLRGWIEQGLPWPKGRGFKALRNVAFQPNKPDLPPADPDAGITNPIDRLLRPYYAAHGVQQKSPVSDRRFARRVYLDLIGLIPPPEEVQAFQNNDAPDKRAKLVEKLLGRREAYAKHWMTFWNDALRNAYRGTGFIDGGRRQLTQWLFRSLYRNKPYDQFVHELISPVEGSKGFIKGIKWRGVVNASQHPAMQAAQNVGQVFLATNLKCASCHDSFVNGWKLEETYRFAAAFAKKPLEIHRCNKPTGEIAKPGFVFPQLGSLPAEKPRDARLAKLADLITKPENGRLARVIVNRLWAELFGRGLAEPVDNMYRDNAWHRKLLDWLAADLQDHGYDLKRTLKLICTSRAYQRPAVRREEKKTEGFVFRGPYVRRMTAEQFVDAVSRLTRRWPEVNDWMLKKNGRGEGGQVAAVRRVLPDRSDRKKELSVDAKWIWSSEDAADGVPGGRVYFRKRLRVEEPPERAVVVLTCDNAFTLFVNGEEVASSEAWKEPVAVEITEPLQKGENVLSVKAANFPVEQGKGAARNPAGLLLYGVGFSGNKTVWEVGSGHGWIWSEDPGDAWQKVSYEPKGWNHAATIGPVDTGPWKIGKRLTTKLNGKLPPAEGDGDRKGVRAVLAGNNALMEALGRPERNYVNTQRESAATRLQALELSNGTTLYEMLQSGAKEWLSRKWEGPAPLVRAIFRRALSREPTPEEQRIATDLVGSPPTKKGVEDLLWAVAMLPEFQLIH